MPVIINGNNTPTAGGIGYGNATELAFTGAGTAGQLVLSGGAGAPTFTTILPVLNGGTGTATPSIVAGTNITISGSWPNQTINSASGGGSVTSVAFSGGTTGLTVTGSPITTSGTITLAGILAIANGGTGTATPAIVAGTNVTVSGSWPNQTINATASGSGTVTSVAATVPTFLSVAGSPITTSGTLAITLSGTALPVANGGTGVTTSTGSGDNVLSTSPTLVTPLLGTPTSGLATNLTGLPLTTGVTGTLPIANGGTGTVTPSIVAGTNVTVSGTWPNQTINSTASGTGDVVGPASSTDNAITRFDLATGKLIQNSLVTVADDGAITAPQVGSVIPFYYANQAAFPSAATYHGALAHSHADGAMFFAHGSVWVRIIDNGGPLGTPASGIATNLTGLPISTGVAGLGTGVATALAVNVGTAGAPVVNGGALGTPSSGTATNLTGLPLSTGVTGTLSNVNGGTGQSSAFTQYGVTFASSASALATTAAGTAGYVLTANASAAPTFQAPASGTTDLLENAQIISTNYVIAALKNAIALGTITINTASSVTVGTGQSWLIFS